MEVLKLRLKIEKERTRSQANEIDSLRHETLSSTEISVMQHVL